MSTKSNERASKASSAPEQKYGDEQKSPTKVSEARAKKNSDLSSADTKSAGKTKGGEEERPTVPVEQRPENRIR